MPAITRRSVLGAIAALPATAAPGRARSPSEAPEAGPTLSSAPVAAAELARYHLEAFKAAAQAADPTITSWWKVVPEDVGEVAFMIVAQRF